MPTRILGDRDRIEQIVSNLVSNALKFTERGIVAVNAFRPAGVQSETYWALQIADSGIGIPPEAQARVFEPFWQLEQSPARRYGGVGLGLAIVKQLTDLMGGQIKLESEVGRGSTFTVVLPLKKRST
jgi:signal transduction histidine kinase